MKMYILLSLTQKAVLAFCEAEAEEDAKTKFGKTFIMDSWVRIEEVKEKKEIYNCQ